MNILVTGATGFIGRMLSIKLLNERWCIAGTLLRDEPPTALISGVIPVPVDPFGEATSYSCAFDEFDVVIHLAARVHVVDETAYDPLCEYRKVNTTGTINLALQAAAHGVKRFVFMSTIGVNGFNSRDNSYKEGDIPHPHNPYSVSKYEAELKLQQISSETGMEIVILRAPLVYGPGNPGNFLSLLHAVQKGIPLPLASVSNRRSLIYVGNLVDVLAICAVHPNAAGNTYLVCDGDDVSTPELLQRTAKSLGSPTRLFPFPMSCIQLAGKLVGKSEAVECLTGSLTVDSSKIRRELNWIPPFTMDEGLQLTAEWFKQQTRVLS